MSKAEELLNAVATNNMAVYTVNPDVEQHIVINDDRTITVPDELKKLAVQYDHNVETVTFDCPRYWDGLDMSGMAIYINYLRPDEKSSFYQVAEVTADTSDDTIMHFDWVISKNVTLVPGQVSFAICIKATDAEGNEQNHWNSEICTSCYVSKGLECAGEVFEEIYPDVIEQWHKEFLGITEVVEDVTVSLVELRDSGELNGATFTPSVSAEGVLSWTNDRDLPNPEPFDVTGATSAATAALNSFVTIGNTEPASGPALWFDTNVT